MMPLRLEWRLALFGVTVALVATGILAWFGRRSVQLEFRRFVAGEEAAKARALAASLDGAPTPAALQAILDTARERLPRDLALLAPDAKCLAAAPSGLCELTFLREPGGELKIVRARGGLRDVRVFRGIPEVRLRSGATLYLLPRQLRLDPEPDGFLETTDRSLAWAAAGAALAAIALSFLWARRMLAPVQELTRVTRRMESGDLSARVAAPGRDEIGTLGQAFNAMAEALARQERLRRELVDDVAHELRTPLTNLRCQLETLQDGLASPTRETIDSMHEEAMLLVRLADDLRDLSLAEAGRLPLRLEPVNLSAEVARAARAFQAPAREKGIELRVAAAEVPDTVLDRERIAQVLNNLLGNAVRFTPAHGNVSLTLTAAGEWAEVAVENSGAGIDAEHLPHIFDRFYRVEGSRSRESGGAGLGLAIVKQLVEAHGGTVSAESTPGRGSRFAFRLPVRPA